MLGRADLRSMPGWAAEWACSRALCFHRLRIRCVLPFRGQGRNMGDTWVVLALLALLALLAMPVLLVMALLALSALKRRVAVLEAAVARQGLQDARPEAMSPLPEVM